MRECVCVSVCVRVCVCECVCVSVCDLFFMSLGFFYLNFYLGPVVVISLFICFASLFLSLCYAVLRELRLMKLLCRCELKRKNTETLCPELTERTVEVFTGSRISQVGRS